MTNAVRGFWILFAVTAVVYLAMALWSVPRITGSTGGLAIFDMRFFGYSDAEARAFLIALDQPGRAFYLTVQQRLDLPFPLLFGSVLAGGSVLLFRGYSLAVRMMMALVPLAGAGVDYVENSRIGLLLRTDVQELSIGQIAAASNATELKFSLYGLGGLVVLVGLVLLAVRRLR